MKVFAAVMVTLVILMAVIVLATGHICGHRESYQIIKYTPSIQNGQVKYTPVYGCK